MPRRKAKKVSDSELVEQSRKFDKAVDEACAGPWTGNSNEIDPDEEDEDAEE